MIPASYLFRDYYKRQWLDADPVRGPDRKEAATSLPRRPDAPDRGSDAAAGGRFAPSCLRWPSPGRRASTRRLHRRQAEPQM